MATKNRKNQSTTLKDDCVLDIGSEMEAVRQDTMLSLLGVSLLPTEEEALGMGYKTPQHLSGLVGSTCSPRSMSGKCLESSRQGLSDRIEVKLPSGKVGWAYRPAQAKE